MMIQVLKSKIHRVKVTESNLHYIGSVTIDEDLMDAANLIENEKVQIVNNNNGERLETYVIRGERGSGMICLNGAAARFFHQGDKVIVMAYCLIENSKAPVHKPKIALIDSNNKVSQLIDHEDANTIG